MIIPIRRTDTPTMSHSPLLARSLASVMARPTPLLTTDVMGCRYGVGVRRFSDAPTAKSLSEQAKGRVVGMSVGRGSNGKVFEHDPTAG